MRAIIFDLDGTLVNSAINFKEMKSRVIEYLQTEGVKPGLLNTSMLNFEITEKAVEHLQQKGFSRSQVKRVLDNVSEIMNQSELESLGKATLMEGVPEALKALRAKGLKLGIMTRSCREYAEKILAKFGLAPYFEALVARDDVERPKPDPEHARRLLSLLDVPPEEALSVGDHWSDAKCASEAGLRFILVRKQGQDVQALEDLDSQAVNSVEDIVDFVEANQ